MRSIIDKEDFFQEKKTRSYSDRLFQAYQEHGEQAIETLREEDPEMWLRIVFEVLPRDVLLEVMAPGLEKG